MFIEVLSCSIVVKCIIDKTGITNYIYDKWCAFVDRYDKCDVFKDELYEEEDQEKILTLGYRDNKTPIKVNMNIDPHMLVVGISNCGKSKMVEKCLQDKKSVTILNAFETDFASLGANCINGNENILAYLETCLEGRTNDSETHYILIDELLVLIKDKKIEKALYDLLAMARHYNIYIICISQEGTKEVIKFKNLFNVRVCMRTLEESSIRAVLGCSVPSDDPALKQREFYIADNQGLRRGKTYDL